MKVQIPIDEFYTLPIKSGTIQNVGNTDIEITDTQEKDTGIIVEPWEKFSFHDTQLYVCAKRGYQVKAYIAVVPFEKSAGRWDLKQIDDMSEFMQGINKLANAKQVKAELGIEGMTAAELADGTSIINKEISPKLLVEYVAGAISALINNAPAALDTLNELAAALGDDENFAATMTTELSKKLGKNETAVNAAKVNNLTVETAVPANAVFTDTTYSPATTTKDGLMSASDKVKLSTLETELSNKLGKNETAANAAKVNNFTVEKAVPANAVFTDTTYSAATQSTTGLMSATDKTKLDGIATGANAYSLPTASSSTLGGVKIGSNVTITNGVISVSGANVKDALGTGSGTSKYLREDGSWVTPPDNNTTYSAATQSAAGLMSAADKTKLDGVAKGANAYSLPTATSSVLGGVKTGTNITNTSGTISLTKANVTDALGYTPPTTNTTYGEATTSAAGLMSASDKTKLNGIATGANAYSLPTATNSVLGGVKTGSNITNSSGTISLTKNNVTSALGFTPDYVVASGDLYRKFASGLIIQWDYFQVTNNTSHKITFPIPFSKWWTYSIIAIGEDKVSNVKIDRTKHYPDNTTLKFDNGDTASTSVSGGVEWIAIGF